MNDCLTHEQVLALVSARRVADVELWSHVTQCGECHRRIAEMTGVAWLAASLEAFQAGAVDGVPHDAVQRVFDRLRPLYEKEVAPLQNCPDDEALLAFTLGDAAAAEETRRHVQQCGSCQKAVVQLRSLHKFVTDYEAFLSAPNETIPDPVARRIFENVSAVCQTEHSASRTPRLGLVVVHAGRYHGTESRSPRACRGVLRVEHFRRDAAFDGGRSGSGR